MDSDKLCNGGHGGDQGGTSMPKWCVTRGARACPNGVSAMTKSTAFAGVAQSGGSHTKAVSFPNSFRFGIPMPEKAARAQFLSETRKSVNGIIPITTPITIPIFIPIIIPITVPITLPITIPIVLPITITMTLPITICITISIVLVYVSWGTFF